MDTQLVPAAPAVIEVFRKPTRLTVRQRKRWSEILLGWDAKNSYMVFDEAGAPVLSVQEDGKGFGKFLMRLFLAAFRPFTAQVEDLASAKPLLHLRRPFRFIFHRLEITGPDGQPLGALQKRWTWFRRKYTVEGPDGREVATLFGPFFRPWTFKILLPGETAEVGLIQKKWSGLAKEMFTQADNFWVELERVTDPSLRALLFAATVLIDVVHFERG
ncbi:MAG: phospholipid scramblase-related protein [Kofleriaceae bacterium]